MTATRKLPQLPSLTGIRAVAALLVFWHHGNEYYDGPGSSGMVGVSLFFILSGFVMAWSDRPDDTTKGFYQRRVARIYPAYAAAATLAIALLFLANDLTPADFFAYTLLQGWVPSSEFYFGANTVFWSLSCEAFFYLVFPIIRRFTRRLTKRGLAFTGLAAAGISTAIGLVGWLGDGAPSTWAIVVLPASRLPEFVIGVVLGSLMVRGWRLDVPPAFAFLLAGVAVALAIEAPYAMSRYVVTLVPFAVLIVALAGADLRGRRSFTQAPWMVTLGAWSYCFYLVHLMVLSSSQAVGGRLGISDHLVVALALPLSVVAAWVLHSVVEVPMERRLRPAARSRHSGASTLDAEASPRTFWP